MNLGSKQVRGIVTAHSIVSWGKKEEHHEEGERHCKSGRMEGMQIPEDSRVVKVRVVRGVN